MAIGALFLTGVAVPQTAASESYLLRSWMNEDGLPQSSVTSIVQTRDGYLWLGTFSGLVRFDGIRFTTFNTVLTPGLPSDWITWLYEDRAGALWIGTRSGLARWDGGQLTRVASESPLGAKDICRIVEPEPGHLIISTTDGIFSLLDGKVDEIRTPSPRWPTRQSWLTLAQDGSVWLAVRDELYTLRGKEILARNRFPLGIHSLNQTRDGAQWVAQEDGNLFQFFPDGRTNHFYFPGNNASSVLQTHEGALWIGTQNGVFQLKEGRLVEPRIAGGKAMRVHTLAEDREGTLWIGTDGAGLCRLDENAVTMVTTADGLGYDDMVTVWQDSSGSILAGGFLAGLNRFEAGKWSRVFRPGLLESNASVSALTRDRQGRLWIGTYGNPSCLMAGDTLELLPAVAQVPIRVFFEDQSGRMWVGTENGVSLFDGDKVRQLTTKDGLSNEVIRCIVQDKAGTIWIGTEKGLNRWVEGKIQSFFTRDGLGRDFIQTLRLDHEGTLWIGTDGGGLTRYRDGHFATIASRQGLFSDVVSQILEDDAGSFWLGSNVGIFRASKQAVNDVLDGKASTVICTGFGKANGLHHLECAGGFQPSCLKARDGHLWFTTVGGIVIIDPRQSRTNDAPPIVHVERIIMDGEVLQPPPGSPVVPGLGTAAASSTSLSSPARPPAIAIPPGEHRLEISYTGLNFQAPAQVQFKYRLARYDAGWVAAGTRRVAYYSHVPPGHYQFRVMAANNQGVWNETPTELAFVVRPMFYQTLWFRGLIVGLIAGGLALYYRIRVEAVRRLERLRFRIAHDLHDEAGSNLASIRLLSRRAAKRAQASDAAIPELTEIHRISETTAESIRNVVWLVDPRFDTLDQLLKGMETYAARLDSEIACDIAWEVDRLDRPLSVEFRSHFFLAFKEILHNIQKHSRATRVEISLSEEQGFFVLRVRDNGAGFEVQSESQDQGHGLSSLRSRSSQLGGHATIESRPSQGTSVTLRVKSPF